MHLTGEVLKNISLENFLQINTKEFVVKFIFLKTPCFQHVIMNNFRWMRLKYENISLRGILSEATKVLLQKLSIEIH